MYGLLLVVMAIYLGRAWAKGRARHARTDADGGSVFVHKAAMEMGYWLLRPLVSALAACHVTPNEVTLFSLVPALLAAVAAAFGRFGLACSLGTLSALCDLVDGVLARETGVASDAGEVLDAAVDRYTEFLLLAGIGVYYRTHWMVLALALGALLGSLMISQSTAMAEARGVTLPRAGSMRRAERAIYLLAALGLTPVTRSLFERAPSHALRELPILFALLLVAFVTNVASVRRFAIIAAVKRARAVSSDVERPQNEAA
ncbi:MAG TPA: CDP-alcohol phosphatidyltransferase family protein [Polyangia bacterium]|nr:CDP-alcohol phosphatidyltransferase family protein [Polyangia bacterium]